MEFIIYRSIPALNAQTQLRMNKMVRQELIVISH